MIANALKPTAGQLKNYQTAKENYDAALLTNNQNQINKAKESLEKAIAAIGTRTAENVMKVASADGKTVAYFNYETTTVLVPVKTDAQTGVTEYKTVASQSYIIFTTAD